MVAFLGKKKRANSKLNGSRPKSPEPSDRGSRSVIGVPAIDRIFGGITANPLLHKRRSVLQQKQPVGQGLSDECGAEEGLRDRNRDRTGEVRHRVPVRLDGDRRGVRRQVHRESPALRRRRPRVRREGGQDRPARRRREPARGPGARGVRGRGVAPLGDGAVRGAGPLRPDQSAGVAAVGGGGGGCDGAADGGGGGVPPPRGGASGHQAGQRAIRRAGAPEAGGLRVGGVLRGRAADEGSGGDALLRSPGGGGREGLRREGGRLERRGAALRNALRCSALLRRNGGRDLRGGAPRQPPLPDAELPHHLAVGQRSSTPDALQGRLSKVLGRASPRASVDNRWRGNETSGGTNLEGMAPSFADRDRINTTVYIRPFL